MSDLLTQRLNQILPKVSSDNFIRGHGIGNEIAFYIFDYPPEDELRIREHIQFLLEHIPKNKPNLRFVHINLFDFLIDYLRERNLLEKSLELQRTKGNTAFLRALKGVFHEEKIAKRLGEIAKPDDHDLVLISGVGGVYPMLRAHTLLNNLHAIMGQTPLVMFYPGKYDKLTLRLFNKTGLSGGSTESRRKGINYYRAFRLID
jgi:hypothetical protein